LPEWKASFIQKVFGVLGFSYSSLDANLLELFVQGKKEKAISLCFTLLPSEDLDNSTIGRHWSEKIIRNLKKNNIQWGLLTNGNQWRIYHLDEPTPYESFLEINLDKILDEEDAKNYMIFFEFMKADNFILDEQSKCKFDEFKQESFAQIEYIEDELKKALKQQEGEEGKSVLNDLCMGYVDYLRSKGTKDFSEQKFRDQIYSGAMLYMFRLLFVFYASARNLLTDDEIKSFHKILNKCVALFHSNKSTKQSFDLWEELREVFGIIDVHYNGGLFDPEENKFIETTRVPDYYLCRVLYNMNFYADDSGNEQSISFRDMGVRHLGTLYEGLLEHKLFVAEENTQVKIEKGIVKFIGESDGGVIVEGGYIKKGVVYFAGDKGERKSTGSFYTPEYIVDYIVNNTVCEKLKELKEEFVKETAGLLEDIKAAPDEAERKALIEDFRDKLLYFVKNKILKLSVLDPAMGSGHFLVSGTNKISNFITEFLNEYDFIFKDTSSTTYWRRRVVENCIYGVDINPLAVELAKLSLWILSMAKDAHLSFLNHHFKCGNSLIGARLADIGIYPSYKTKTGQISFNFAKEIEGTIQKVISDYLAIEGRVTINKDDIEFKKELLDEINETLKPYKKVCDYHTSIYFSNNVNEAEYFTKIKKPETIKVSGNNYFHWELEFPEIFQSINRLIIVGNPPYDVLNPTENDSFDYLMTEYFNSSSYYALIKSGKSNLYKLFVFQCLYLFKYIDTLSFIIPLAVLSDRTANKLRNYIIDNYSLEKVDTFSERDDPKLRVFKDAKMSVCVIKITKKNIEDINIIIHKTNIIEEAIGVLKLSKTDLKLFDPKDYTIPIVNQMDWNIIKQILVDSISLDKYAKCIEGEINLTFHKKYFSETPAKGKSPLIRGAKVNRYKVNEKMSQGKDLFLDEKRYTEEINSAKIKDAQNERIVLQGITGVDEKTRIKATIIPSRIYCGNSLNYIRIDKNIDPYLLLGIINSYLINWYFKTKSTNSNVNGYEIDELPFRNLTKYPKSIAIISKYLVFLNHIKDPHKELLMFYDIIIDFLIYKIYFSHNSELHSLLQKELIEVELILLFDIEKLTLNVSINEYKDEEFINKLVQIKKSIISNKNIQAELKTVLSSEYISVIDSRNINEYLTN
jgi:Alw26I/Eco31I/Esp3I family type II restriction m6 adenine DNA methyltransferase